MSNYIYFAEAINGLVKIGWSADLRQRMRHLRSVSPLEIRLMHCYECENDPKAEEAFLHSEFASWRSHGEWFKLTKKQKRAIIRRGRPPGTIAIRPAKYQADSDLIPCPDCLHYCHG